MPWIPYLSHDLDPIYLSINPTQIPYLSNLTLSSNQNDAGEFACKVTYDAIGSTFDGGFDTHDTVTLGVYGVTDLSVSSTVANKGGSVTITCTADFLPSAVFIWYKNGFETSTGPSTQISLSEVCLSNVLYNI